MGGPAEWGGPTNPTGEEMDAFIGTILVWPITWAPDGWNACNGTILQVQQYQALYSLIGNTFGGSGTTTMGLPDLRGRSPLGYNPNSGALPFNTVGLLTGNTATTLTLNNLPQHNHVATFAPAFGQQTITIPAVQPSGSLSVAVAGTVNTTTAGTAAPASGADVYLGGLAAKLGANFAAVTGPYDSTKAATTGNLKGLSATVTSTGYNPGSPSSTATINVLAGGNVSVAPGGGVTAPMPFTNYQPSMALNFIICLIGLYPMRP